MARIDQTGSPSSTICWARGDSSSREFQVKDGDGIAINITGFSFIMTIDSRKNPDDALTNQFSITGAISDAVNGKVTFSPTAVNTDIPIDLYYYDVQMTDGIGEISTLIKALVEIVQDISK